MFLSTFKSYAWPECRFSKSHDCCYDDDDYNDDDDDHVTSRTLDLFSFACLRVHCCVQTLRQMYLTKNVTRLDLKMDVVPLFLPITYNTFGETRNFDVNKRSALLVYQTVLKFVYFHLSSKLHKEKGPCFRQKKEHAIFDILLLKMFQNMKQYYIHQLNVTPFQRYVGNTLILDNHAWRSQKVKMNKCHTARYLATLYLYVGQMKDHTI